MNDDLSDWECFDADIIFKMEDFFHSMMRELCMGQGTPSRRDLWYEWISDGGFLHDESYQDKPYTREEEQRAKLLAGPYGRVLVLAWLQARKKDNVV